MEIHRDRLILYGCGDLLNDYEGIGGYEAFRSDLVAAYLARLGPDGALERLTITPFQIRRFRLNHATGEATRFLAARLAEHSPGLLFQSTEGGLIEASWR